MPASYPTSSKVFTTKSDGAGNTILAAHINDLQLEVSAIETDLITGLPIARGGTGLTSLTANRIPYGNGTSALQSASNFTFDGTTLTTPGQIAFPATQSASSNANTLDDYEEGTWTPVIGGSTGTSGQSYTTQVGWYVKVGRKVTCWFNATLSSKGTISGNAEIQGLPFTVQNTSNQIAAGIVSDFAGLASNLIYISLVASPNTTVAAVKGTAAAVAAAGTVGVAVIDNTTQLVGCITYTATT